MSMQAEDMIGLSACEAVAAMSTGQVTALKPGRVDITLTGYRAN